jgi:glycerol-3-phosphate O-acyltransferase/dihydroxyacetone phosphate acyltransferase
MSVKRRNMLHLTAKSTQFGKRSLTSWLIEAAGTVPVQRRKDFAEGVANNDASMAVLRQVWGLVGYSEIF